MWLIVLIMISMVFHLLPFLRVHSILQSLLLFVVGSVVTVYLMSVVLENSWYLRSAYFPRLQQIWKQKPQHHKYSNGTLLMLK